MNKLANGFVIAACSVVIAAGGYWLFEKFMTHQAIESCIVRMVAQSDKNEYWKNWWPSLTPDDKRNEWIQECTKEPLRRGI